MADTPNAKTRLLDTMIKHDMTAHMARCILFLFVNGNTRIGKLGFGFKPSGVGGTVNKLEARGMAKRVKDERSDKVVWVELTPMGRAVGRMLNGG